MDFDIIPFDDIVWGRRLGAGSFGSVFKGQYLGIDIAIKEVLPSTEYDVHKYFEREWRIMRECRHPNIVLFLGLSKAPGDDGRVFIISEYVPRGNLRQYILSSHPFPWRLRLSFATDVARAVAYLHARQCIHRDLKGENLLLTSNERVKVTDFGFARIASRNAEEMRRMTYCGTDGYMSPEIINGQEFDLPTDVFSLGIIFIEILSRKLVDSRTYTRTAPHFTPDPAEVRRRASPGCSTAFVDLALACCTEKATDRPHMPEVLARLREIELEVLSRTDEAANEHVGSIRLVNHGGKRAMPDFAPPPPSKEEAEEEEERQMEEQALVTLAGLDLEGGGASVLDSEGGTWRTARWDEGVLAGLSESNSSEIKGHQRLLPSSDTSSSFASDQNTSSTYSTDVVRAKPVLPASALKAAIPFDEEDAGSTVTLRGAPTLVNIQHPPSADTTGESSAEPAAQAVPTDDTGDHSHIGTIPSLASSEMVQKKQTKEKEAPVGEKKMLMTKHEEAKKELEEAERIRAEGVKPGDGGVGTHRFTLLESSTKASAFTSNFAFAFLQKQLAPGKQCSVCNKRLNQRPALQCDDCDVIVHVKCSPAAPRNCSGGNGEGLGKQ